MAAAWNFITNTIPSSLEFSSPVRPLLKVNQQDFLVVHNVAQVKGALGLADNVAHHFVTQERAELTDEPAGHFTELIGALRLAGISFCQNSSTFMSVNVL